MNSPSRSNSRLLSYLQLLRIPNVFTAIADVTMGFLFVGGKLPEQLIPFLGLVTASSCLYLSGMVLNDVFDFAVDQRDRPDRPLPSGRISRRSATILGVTLLGIGTASAWLVDGIHPFEGAPTWRSGVIATLLAIMIVTYDGVVKKTLFAPLAMGSCRLLNVFLGMSVVRDVSSPFGFRTDQWLIAGGMGVYIVGVTLFARNEAHDSRRSSLISATCVMLLGIVMLGLFPFAPQATPTLFTHIAVWPFLLSILTFSVFRRCGKAIHTPTPSHVQNAVKQAIMTLIVLNAAICLATVGTFYAVFVLSLLLPTLLLGRWVYST
ncbi:MAG: UbiA family prenyltransferase [Planctomycetaceae bacterium]|nr:UbiA family prenyltransferase [Planctomycetaceae bacterium]